MRSFFIISTVASIKFFLAKIAGASLVKNIAVLSLLGLSNPSEAQFASSGICSPSFRIYQFSTGVPVCSSTVIMDATPTLIRVASSGFKIDFLNSGLNDGTPASLLWVDASGNFKRSLTTDLTLTSGQVTTALGGTPITTEVDPIFIASSAFGISGGNITTWNAKQNSITTGTTAQYFKGDLSLATFPTALSSFSNDAGYLTSASITGKLNLSDTSSMLSTYYRSSNPSSYITAAGITGKVNISDTSSMLSTYYRSSNPSAYITSSAITGKLNISDTATMLSPYLRTVSLTWSNVTGKPTFATVATSGAYSDLTGTPTPVVHYNSAGVVTVTKVWHGTITPNTGNGYSIDISSAGFSNIYSISIEGIKSTATPTSAPKVSIKSYTTSAIVINVIEGNSSTVNILGSLVLLGTSEQFINVTGLTLSVMVEGN